MSRKNKLTDVDKKIMFGLVTKNPHRYVENQGFKHSIKKIDKP